MQPVSELLRKLNCAGELCKYGTSKQGWNWCICFNRVSTAAEMPTSFRIQNIQKSISWVHIYSRVLMCVRGAIFDMHCDLLTVAVMLIAGSAGRSLESCMFHS